jgi:FixJ family two-component response regulator
MTSSAMPTVYIVDDNESVRDALSLVLSLEGCSTAIFGSAEDFCAAYRDEWRGCLLLDMQLDGASGLELQAELMARGSRLAIVIITGYGDAASARAALKAGAVDYLEKPIDPDQLVDVVRTALEHDAKRDEQRVGVGETDRRHPHLTPRERQVMDLMVGGRHNREIAEALGISVETVVVYRGRVMEKLQVHNLAELIHFSLAAERAPGS